VTHPSLARRVAGGALSLCLAGTVLSAVTSAEAQETVNRTVHVRINADRQISMPSHLRPGVHRFVVRSAKTSSFQIVKARAGYTKRDLAHDVSIMFDDVKAFKRFERNVRLYGGVPSRHGEPGVMRVRLRAGHYWVTDTNEQTTSASDLTDLQVGGDRTGGRIGGTATLRAINEVDFAKRPRSIASKGLLRLRNDSVDNHFFEIAKLAPGKTMKDFRAWIKAVKKGENVPPPINDQARSIDSGVISPGLAMSMPYHLSPGRYVVICWWSDADMDLMPHAFMGMYRGLRVR
jgi:hypothetical protein